MNKTIPTIITIATMMLLLATIAAADTVSVFQDNAESGSPSGYYEEATYDNTFAYEGNYSITTSSDFTVLWLGFLGNFTNLSDTFNISYYLYFDPDELQASDIIYTYLDYYSDLQPNFEVDQYDAGGNITYYNNTASATLDTGIPLVVGWYKMKWVISNYSTILLYINDTYIAKDNIHFGAEWNSTALLFETDGGLAGFWFDNVNITYEGAAPAPIFNGSGTIGDPYIIETPTQYVYMLANNIAGEYYELANDIDMDSDTINTDYTFAATFNGNNHTISNLHTNTSNAMIKTMAATANFNNVTFNNMTAGGSTRSFLVRTMLGNMSYIDVNGASAPAQTADFGIVAYDVNGAGTPPVTMTNIRFRNVEIVQDSGTPEIDVYGIAYRLIDFSKANNIEIEATVNSTGGVFYGLTSLIAPQMPVNISNVALKIDVIDTYGFYAFTRVSTDTYETTLQNIYYSGTTTVSNNPYELFVASTNTGNLTCNNNYYDYETVGTNTTALSCVTAKTTAQMKQETTYTGWDFTDTWKMLNGITTPYLQYFPTLIPNNAPSIDTATPTSPVTLHAPTSQTFTITASDPENDNLTYQWYIDGGDQSGETGTTYDFAVVLGDAGTYNISVAVTDGEYVVEESWEVTVTEGYQETYTSNDLSAVIVDGTGKVLVTWKELAAIIAIVAVLFVMAWFGLRNPIWGTQSK